MAALSLTVHEDGLEPVSPYDRRASHGFAEDGIDRTGYHCVESSDLAGISTIEIRLDISVGEEAQGRVELRSPASSGRVTAARRQRQIASLLGLLQEPR